MKPVDYTGQRFGKLTVGKRVETANKSSGTKVECVCDCGNATTAYISNMQRGLTKSCGCLQKEAVRKARTTHGMKDSSEYVIWFGMKARCYNPKSTHYKDYGGRGIAMCDEWKESFEAFYRDMGPRPSPDHTVDRKDNDKGYSKDNCRWATWAEQGRNRRNNLYYVFDGERKTLSEWCRELRIDYSRMYYLLSLGMDFEDAADAVILETKRKAS